MKIFFSIKLFLLLLGKLSFFSQPTAQEIALTIDISHEEREHHTFALADGGFIVAFSTNATLTDDRDLYFQRITDDLEIYDQETLVTSRVTME